MRDDDALARRAKMFDRPQPTYAGTAAPGRGLMDVPVRCDPSAAVYESTRGRGMGAFVVLHDALRGYADRRRLEAQKDILDAIREQLQPGEEVEVIMNGLDVFGGTYDDVSIGETGAPSVRDSNAEVRRVVGGKPGDADYDQRRPPANKDFIVPTTGGWKFASLPKRGPSASPSDARPGRGEMKDWTGRWNRDPGLIDHDFQRADTISRTA